MEKDVNEIIGGINGNIDAAKNYFNRSKFNDMSLNLPVANMIVDVLENSATIQDFSHGIQHVISCTMLYSKLTLLYNIAELLEMEVSILKRNETPVSESNPTSNMRYKSAEESSKEMIDEKKDIPVKTPSSQTNSNVFAEIRHIELVLELYRYALRVLELTT